MTLQVYLSFIFNKRHFRVLFVIITLGFIVSLFLISIQLFVLNALCQYCLVSEFISITLFFIILKIKILNNKEVLKKKLD